MGPESLADSLGLMTIGSPPEPDQIEVSLFGPGYGECALLHVGNGNWVVVDSCLNPDSEPVALAYLSDLGSNPAEAVRLVVATHWHDDHIRGMGHVIEVCMNATFCCASALRREEFLTAVGVLEGNPATPQGSGMQELYRTLSSLTERSSRPVFAIANRRIFNQDGCEIWSLSPFDKEFEAFLAEISHLLPTERETKRRFPTLTPNRLAVVLLVKIDDTTILLGSDMEGQGWLEILDTWEQPLGRASVFKIPHHGSGNAHEDRVWDEMLVPRPIAMLTPWRRGGHELPTDADIQRINSLTETAYVTTSRKNPTRRRRMSAVERSVRETGATIRRLVRSPGAIRLRKQLGSQSPWDVEMFGAACQLVNY